MVLLFSDLVSKWDKSFTSFKYKFKSGSKKLCAEMSKMGWHVKDWNLIVLPSYRSCSSCVVLSNTQQMFLVLLCFWCRWKIQQLGCNVIFLAYPYKISIFTANRTVSSSTLKWKAVQDRNFHPFTLVTLLKWFENHLDSVSSLLVPKAPK